MSFTFDETDYPIALIKGGEDHGRLIYLTENVENDAKFESLKKMIHELSVNERKRLKTLFDTEKFQDFDHYEISSGKMFPVPYRSKNSELDGQNRDVIYVYGPSGSGKSTFCSNFMKLYSKMNPKNKIICFSSIKNDKAFEGIPIKYVPLNDDFLELELNIEDLSHALLLFDDIDSLANSKVKCKCIGFRDKCLEIGRHNFLSILCTSHLGAKGKETKTLLNEAHKVVLFPSVSSHTNKYVLKEYLGIPDKTIGKLLKKKKISRWLCFSRLMPQYVVSEKDIQLIE